MGCCFIWKKNHESNKNLRDLCTQKSFFFCFRHVEEVFGHDESASDGSETVSKMRQNLQIGSHVKDASRRQTHDLSWLQMCFVWNRREIEEFPSLAHVETAQRHQYERFTGTSDAGTFRSRFSKQVNWMIILIKINKSFFYEIKKKKQF